MLPVVKERTSRRGLRWLLAALTFAGCASVEPASFQVRLVSPQTTPDTETILFTRQARGARGSSEHLYVHRRPLLDGQAIKHAKAERSPYDGQMTVYLTWTDEGGKAFAKLTRENIGKRLAMMVDGEIVVAPVVLTEVDGSTVMLGNLWTDDEAKNLAAKLNRAVSK